MATSNIAEIPTSEKTAFFSGLIELGFMPKQFMLVCKEEGDDRRLKVYVIRLASNGNKTKLSFPSDGWVRAALDAVKAEKFGAL